MKAFDYFIIILFIAVCISILKDIATYIKVRYNLNSVIISKKTVAGIMALIMYLFFPYVYCNEELKSFRDICMPEKKFELKDYVSADEEVGKNKKKR